MRGSPTPARQQLGPTRFERRGADARKLGHHVWFKLLLAISWLSTTQFSVGATTEYLRRNWLVDDGVPHNVVNRVVQDSAGYLWLATGAGLARFDGRDFQLRPLPERSANMNLNIRDLTTEANGTLLFLPASGGIVRYRDGTFSPHPASAAVAGTSLVDIFAEPNGTLWLGAENETLIRWQDGHSAIFGPADGLKRRGNGFTFAIDQSGRTWVAGGDFCGWYEGGHLHALTDNVGTSVTVAPARSGGVWISSFQHLSKWENGKLATVVESNRWPLARSTVHWMYEDSSGDLWLATRRDGLFHLSGGRVIPVATTSPLVSSVNADRDGNIWVTMEGGGLDRIRPKAFELLDRASGLSEDVSTSVCSDAHGAIWCANRNGGLVRYFAGTTELIAKNDEGSGFFAISLCPDQQDHIWVGTTSGLFRTRASTPYSIETVTTDLSGVRGLFCSKRGDVWVASRRRSVGLFSR